MRCLTNGDKTLTDNIGRTLGLDGWRPWTGLARVAAIDRGNDAQTAPDQAAELADHIGLGLRGIVGGDLRGPDRLDAGGVMMAKKPKRPVEAYESFLFEIMSASPYYSFGLAHRPDEPDPYGEHPAWKVEGRCLHPARFAERIVQFHLVGDRRLIAEKRDRTGFREGPHGVGLMDADKTRFTVYASLPVDALWSVGAGMSSGAVRYIATHGPRLVRGKAMITSIRFEGAGVDMDDWA